MTVHPVPYRLGNLVMPLLALAAASMVNLACGHTETKPEVVPLLSTQENIALAANGGRAVAVNSAGPNFPIASLNDGTPAPWGSAEGQKDVYAAVVLPAPKAVGEFRIMLFSPAQPPRPHLRDIRVVVADAEEPGGMAWRTVRARLSKGQPFAERVTVPAAGDETVVLVEIDRSDINWGAHKIWGIACLAASRGDALNYLPPGGGNAIYLRELQMK